MQETQGMCVWSLDWEDLLEEKMAPHSIILAWKKKKKNITNRGAWQAAVQQVAKSWTWTSNWACVCCGSVVPNSLQRNRLQHTRLHYLQEFAQTRVQWVGDAIRPSHPLLTLPVCRALTHSTVSTSSTHIVPQKCSTETGKARMEK